MLLALHLSDLAGWRLGDTAPAKQFSTQSLVPTSLQPHLGFDFKVCSFNNISSQESYGFEAGLDIRIRGAR